MDKNWYQLTEEEVENKLLTNPSSGLTKEEANIRLKKYGKNILPKKKRDNFFKIMLHELLDPIVILLIITVIFSFIIGEHLDAIAIIFIIMVDLLMGTFQEWKAEKTAESLSSLMKENVYVIRNGEEIEIDYSELVVGDVVLLVSGMKLSADLRIIECQNLQIDESILTGESLNVEKNNQVLDKISSLADRKNMAYAGTSVVTGRGKGLVVETALNTEIGKIANHVIHTKAEKSPLTIRMQKFSKQITILIVIIAIIITTILFSKGVPGTEIFLSVIALSVSAMPEGLPLALTMALTIASGRMSKKNVVVKKLNSVESLGSCTVIASDKTGTLTINEQTAKKIILPDDQSFNVDGIGYNDNGKITPIKESDLNRAYYISKLGYINNESHLDKKDNAWQYHGDSIDIAFLALGKKIGVDTSDIKILKVIPYESENKYSAIFYEKNDKVHCTVKGSLEKVIEFSNKMYFKGKELPIDKNILEKQNENLASEGYRVIALADAVLNKKSTDEYEISDIKDLTFMGMVAFIDPIREEVKQSIVECREAGIKVIMITGDHPLTALSIAKELDLVEHDEQISTGIEVEEHLKKSPQEFDDFISKITVFSRVNPMEKLEIINSLKRQGEYVAVTGDGVNDAPAIRSSNIGIAMGSGTDVAKETASMIVLDDNFTSIVSGIEEGRCAYSNIRKVSYMLLSCGLAEVLFFILAILFNLPMPLVAIQLLWLNIVTDGLQDFALSFEKIESNVMKEPPRSTKETVFNKELLLEVGLSGLVIGLIVFCVWVYLINSLKLDVGIARGYIMVLMVFMQNIHVLNCRSEKQSTFKISLKSNPLIIFSIISSIILQVIVMEVPFLSSFLQTSTVPFNSMIKLFLLSLIILIVMELYKKIKYRN